MQRGTFSHRHAVATDQKTGRQHTFLNAIAPAAGDPAPASKLYIENSPLSEYAVLGYELGYSMENPDQLVLWEAQFGDFVNGAQIIIDQFISSGEAKWMRQSGLVMLLPHGYQGQGPEHSSCRIERFLQSSDEDPDTIPPDLDTPAGRLRQVQRINWQVVNVSTPANYYHVLRRQLHREFRKPLIVAGTKALLRDELAVSPLADFGPGSAFKRVIGEIEPAALKPADGVRRVVLCSGKVYYELLKERRAQGIDDVAIVRLEQFTPFPFQDVAAEARTYPNAEIVWCQEEPKNAGGWLYVRDRILTATRKMNGEVRRPAYVGRRTMASPAEGYGNVHTRERTRSSRPRSARRSRASPSATPSSTRSARPRRPTENGLANAASARRAAAAQTRRRLPASSFVAREALPPSLLPPRPRSPAVTTCAAPSPRRHHGCCRRRSAALALPPVPSRRRRASATPVFAAARRRAPRSSQFRSPRALTPGAWLPREAWTATETPREGRTRGVPGWVAVCARGGRTPAVIPIQPKCPVGIALPW